MAPAEKAESRRAHLSRRGYFGGEELVGLVPGTHLGGVEAVAGHCGLDPRLGSSPYGTQGSHLTPWGRCLSC